MAKLFISFDHDEIQNEIPYMIIAETTSRSVWDTGKRKRMMCQCFNESEREKIRSIINQAHKWAFITGVPIDGVKMTLNTRGLWNRLAYFCSNL